METSLRVLMVGGDASLWIGLSGTLGRSSSQIYVPKETDETNLLAAGTEVDVIVMSIPRTGEGRFLSLRALRAAELQRRTVALAAPDDQEAAIEAVRAGVAGFVQTGSDPTRLAAAITHVVEKGTFYDSSAAAELRSQLERGEGTGMHMSAAKALASALELKDTYTGGHAERVTSMALRLARAAMLEEALPSEALEMAFLLHDVGKIGIPESILNKSGVLTDTERRVLQTHPILGEKVVAPLGLPEVVRKVIRHHHERWDGLGYPDGLSGTDIPAAARLFSIADVIDAMTSVRPYRRPVSLERAVEEILNNAGSQFDPTLAAMVEDAFLDEPLKLLHGELG
jgi:ribonuclease P protein subunit RPR2